MTEEEAKSRWCPFVRAKPGVLKANGGIESDARAPAFNRWEIDKPGSAPYGPAAMCIGSLCMAWRRGRIIRHELDGAEVSAWHHDDAARVVTVRSGFCGLAGVPQ